MDIDRERIAFYIAALFGILSFAVVLAIYNIADGDLWARLAQGASIWYTGHLIHKDIFAFTPVLPIYIDHEWLSGLIFFALLKFFGPLSLMIFKIITAVGAVFFALAAGRGAGCGKAALFYIALPCAACVIPGFVPVVRSHVFTYLFFGTVIFCLEMILRGRRWPAAAVVILMVVWANCHGGFVSGLGMIAIYTLVSAISKKNVKTMAVLMVLSSVVTFINPYGAGYWRYLIPALMHPRPMITEWKPMPFFSMDAFIGFRVLFVMAICVIAIGWNKELIKRSPQSLIILLVTAYLAIRHRRHAPFFGLAAAAFLGQYLEMAIKKISSYRSTISLSKIGPAKTLLIIYFVIAGAVVSIIGPRVSMIVLAPVGFYPVREVDVLDAAKATGNLVVPLRWGDYAAWRLYPRVKISICGRYETMYPDSTYELTNAFYSKGPGWDRIIREYEVDYVMLELNNTMLSPNDMDSIGFLPVWSNGYSALFARRELAGRLRNVAACLPPYTIDPLDASIPSKWWA